MLELALVVLIAGVGSAFALGSTGTLKTGGDYAIDLAQGGVSDAADLSATDYTLTYDSTAANLVSVTVEVTNSNASDKTANITVTCGDSAWTTTETGTNSSVTCTGSTTTDSVVTLGSPLAVTSLDKVHVYIEQTD